MNKPPDSSNNPTASVVIGFKDWGIERLKLSILSLNAAFGNVSFEIIVSDYGSVLLDPLETQASIEALGARYVYTSTDGKWSRSRALNAGFAISRGEILICTDADMLFSPESLAPIVHQIQATDRDVVVIQCRDLPSTHSHEHLHSENIDWKELETVSRLRPRWGMGGMIAFSREAFIEIRGLDERFEVYGGEDLDFAKRMKRAGRAVQWWDNSSSRMYHIWHEPSRDVAAASEDGRRAIAFNRKIHSKDLTVQRNVISWKYAVPDRDPLFSVVIATHNRADFLPDAVNSVLSQTVEDLELVIIDDGSTDHTGQVVTSFNDKRIRYFYQDQRGLAAARNYALDVSRGQFTIIHDDDDIMLPWRLENHLSKIEPGAVGSYGGWIDFRGDTGEMTVQQGKELSQSSLLFTGGVYLHPTLMVRTDVLRKLRYTESFRSGSDYSLGVKLVRSGFRLNHTNSIHIVRRLHAGQITQSHGVTQKSSAVLAGFMARAPMCKDDVENSRKLARELKPNQVPGINEVFSQYGAYLPDALVSRDAMLDSWVPNEVLIASLGRSRGTEFASYRVRTMAGEEVFQGTIVRNCTWNDIAKLRTLGPVTLSNPVRKSDNSANNSDPTPTSQEQSLSHDEITGIIERMSILNESSYILAPTRLSTETISELGLVVQEVLTLEYNNPCFESETFSLVTGRVNPVATLDYGVAHELLPANSSIRVPSMGEGHTLLRSFANASREGKA